MEKPRQRRKELYPGNRQIGNRVRELFIALPPPKSGNVVNRPFRPGWKREQQEKKDPADAQGYCQLPRWQKSFLKRNVTDMDA